MSSIKLTADSGGGTFELKAPASSSNTRVLTLPDTGNLTLGGPYGKILQVVSGSQQVAASQGFSSDSFVDTGLSASITPSSSSSKVFVTGYLSWRFEMSQNGNAQWNFAITDGSNNILDAMTNDLFKFS